MRFYRQLFRNLIMTPGLCLVRIVDLMTKGIRAPSLILSQLGLQLLGLSLYHPSVTGHSVSLLLLLRLLIIFAALHLHAALRNCHLD